MFRLTCKHFKVKCVETLHSVRQTSLNHDDTKHTATKLQHQLGKSLTLTQTHSNRCQIAFLQHNVQLLYSGQLAQMRCSAPSLHSWAWLDQPGTQLWEEVRLVLEKLPEVRLAFWEEMRCESKLNSRPSASIRSLRVMASMSQSKLPLNASRSKSDGNWSWETDWTEVTLPLRPDNNESRGWAA